MNKDNLALQTEVQMSDSSPKKLDIQELMQTIRERVKSDIDANRDLQKSFKAYQANGDNKTQRKAGELMVSQDLKYLNHNYNYSYRSEAAALTSKLPGIFGKLVAKVKRKVISIRENLLRDYLNSESIYQSHLVRYLNDISKYVDERDGAIFWELIRKIDYDNTKALERIERINDEQMAALRSSERRIYDSLWKALQEQQDAITNVQSANAQNESKLQQIDSVVLGLESIIAKLKPQNAGSTLANSANVNPEEKKSSEATDFSYLLLENRFRGSEEEITKRLSIYPEFFKSSKNPVLEIGTGRGELQQLFKNAGKASYSVDTDKAMVELSVSKGFDVRLEDGIKHLAGLSDHSVGGVIAIQVVEHLTRMQLENLIKLCAQKVEKGGRIIFETINPQSLLALSSNYFRDLTHVWPLHPDTLSYVMQLAGLKVLEVKYLSKVPDGAQLKPLQTEEYMTPRWTYTIERLNQNMEQLNNLIYGYQDYCIVAEVI